MSVPVGRPLPSRARRLVEVLGVSLAGTLVLYVATRWGYLGPFLALGFVILMLPAVVDRWRAPLLGYMPGWHLFMWAALTPLLKFGWIAFLLLPPVISIHFVVQAILAWSLHRVTRWPLFLVMPLSITAGEWTRGILGVGNFNMFQVGTFLFDYPVLLQSADLVGSYGLSFLWTVPFGLLADGIKSAIDGPPPHAERRWRLGLACSLAALVFLLGYGAVRSGGVPEIAGPRVAVVQPALEHSFQLTPKVLTQTVQQTLGSIPPGSADLVVWPENAILANLDRWPEYEKSVATVASTLGAPVLFGSQNLGPDGARPTNTALIIDPDGQRSGRYDKVVLFPFTERRAFRSLETRFPRLAKLLTRLTLSAWRNAPDGWSGPGAIPLELEADGRTWKLWTPLCYESCYPELGREARRRGADFFVNLTSEGWLGWAVSHNQMGVNILRAVENRVGMVRAGNTGPSAFVAPDGRVEEYLLGGKSGRMRLEAGELTRRVTVSPQPAPLYTRIGNRLDRAWALAWALGVAGGLLHRRVRRSRTAR